MAIVQNPITGRSSGKFGTGIFQTQFGVNILRTMPGSYRDAKTPGQLAQRGKFKIAAEFIRGCYPWIKSTFPISKVRMNPFAYVLPSVLAAVTEPGQGGRVAAELAFSKFLPHINSEFKFFVDQNDFVQFFFNPSLLWPSVVEGDILCLLVHHEDNLVSGTAEFTITSTVMFLGNVNLPGHGEGDTVICYASIKRITALAIGAEIIQSVY